MVEDRPIMSVKYCLPVPVFYFFGENYNAPIQRGLSAIAEHFVGDVNSHSGVAEKQELYLSGTIHLYVHKARP